MTAQAVALGLRAKYAHRVEVVMDFGIVELSKDLSSIFDARFADDVMGLPWHANAWGYAQHKYSATKPPISLHRFILSLVGQSVSDGMQVDHINRDKLDNRLCNLRIVTPSENSLNRGPRVDNVSGVPGISPRGNGTWTAGFGFQRKWYRVGTFKTVEEARIALEKAKQDFWGATP